MGLLQKNKIKIILPVMAVMIILLLSAPVTVNGSEDTDGRKVVVFLLDGLSLSDLDNFPNLKDLADHSGVGLINTRTKSLTTVNRASGYLTMGMGVRIQVAEPAGGYKIDSSPVEGSGQRSISTLRNVDSEVLNEIVYRNYPKYTLGKLGELAKQYGIKVALVGNSDTDRPDNDATLLAMDKSGLIPFGNTSPSLLVKDSQYAWGSRTNPEKLLNSTLEVLTLSDLTFIDFGDTARVSAAVKRDLYDHEQIMELKSQALTNADFFLGRLLKTVDWQKTVLIIVSPTPPLNEPAMVNNSLAPIIIYDKNQAPGVLNSNTTRRTGLAANIDIGPTIFAKLGYDPEKMNFIGESITTLPSSDNLGIVANNLDEYLRVKTSRYIVHGIYVILLLAALITLYLTIFKLHIMVSPRMMRALAVMTIAWPAAALLATAAAQAQLYYLYLALACLLTVLLGWFLSKTSAAAVAGMGWLSLSTALFLLIVTLIGLRFLYNTPLGFNDVFSGGRYYGMNNDCMGLLLGSTVFAMFYWFHRIGLKRPLRVIIGLAWLLAVIVTQTPGLGANVGGTIAAMTTGVVTLMILAFNRPLQKRWVVATVALVFTVELGIAYFDYLNGSQTHAGKVWGALLSEGFGTKFAEILKSKLSLFGVMLILPPWNILFGAELYICFLIKQKMQHIRGFVEKSHPAQFNSFEAIFYSGIVAFAFNDTGIIATAIIFTYLTMPLAAVLSEYKFNI